MKRILFIEDNEDDVALVRESLPAEKYAVERARTGAEGEEELRHRVPDLILLDHGLPDTNGLALLQKIVSKHPRLPIVFLTGRQDDVLNMSARQKGAVGFLVKDELGGGFEERIDRILASFDFDGGHASGASAAGSMAMRDRMDHLYSMLVSTMNEGFLLVDTFGIVTFANEACESLFRTDHQSLVGKHASEFFNHSGQRRLEDFLGRLDGSTDGISDKFEARALAPDGNTAATVLCSLRSIYGNINDYEAFSILISDITELAEARNAIQGRLEELERFQRFFLDRERRIIELKEKLFEYEKKLGIELPGLSEATRDELKRRVEEKGITL